MANGTPPQWAKFLAGLVIAVVCAVISTIAWLDTRYATKHDFALVNKDLETLDAIETKIETVDEKITELRVMVARLADSP